MKKTAEEILNETSPTRPWPEGGKTDAMIIKCMKIYADQFKSKWIPVGESLPEVNDPVLVIDKWGYMSVCAIDYEKRWYPKIDGSHPNFTPDSITHWQPLPSAPERKEEVGE